MYGLQCKLYVAASLMVFLLLSAIVTIVKNPALYITIVSQEENASFLLHQTVEHEQEKATLLREQRDAISRQLNLLQVRMR